MSMQYNDSQEPAPESQQAQYRPKSNDATLEDFLFFRRMLSPLVVQIAFWVGFGVICILGFLLLRFSVEVPFAGVRAAFAGLGFVSIVFGFILWRIACEFLIVTYRMYETLTSIDNKLGKTQ